jgi:hypothetical protein
MVLFGLFLFRQDLRCRRSQHMFVDQETIDIMFPNEHHSNERAMTAMIYVTAPTRIRVGQPAAVLIKVFTGQSKQANFRLSASGLDVEPNDWIPISAASEDGSSVALWSIRASSPGTYSLVFNAKIDQQSNNVEMFVVHFFPSDTFAVSVVRGWNDYFSMVLGPVVAFMGSLLTLPGIISFLENRKRKREEQRRAIQSL